MDCRCTLSSISLAIKPAFGSILPTGEKIDWLLLKKIVFILINFDNKSRSMMVIDDFNVDITVYISREW